MFLFGKTDKWLSPPKMESEFLNEALPVDEIELSKRNYEKLCNFSESPCFGRYLTVVYGLSMLDLFDIAVRTTATTFVLCL